MNEDNHHVFVFEDGERSVEVTAHYRRDGYVLDLPGGSCRRVRRPRPMEGWWSTFPAPGSTATSCARATR
jgi:hypothetical protein